MTKEEFIRKHGEIKVNEEQDNHFATLKHPVYKDGTWKRYSVKGMGTKILDGTFYNIGYFGSNANPLKMSHNWEALDYAIDFTQKITNILRENDCLALSSEGDADFFPFIFTTLDNEGFPDDDALQIAQPKEVADAYANGEMRKSYSIVPEAFDLEDNECIFWDDEHNDNILSDLGDGACYNAYKEASDLIKAELTNISCIHYYEDYTRFPAVYGGKDKYGHFIGVITSLVWT